MLQVICVEEYLNVTRCTVCGYARLVYLCGEGWGGHRGCQRCGSEGLWQQWLRLALQGNCAARRVPPA